MSAARSAPALAQNLITKAELSVALRKSPRTINTLMRRGMIPYIKLGSGRQADVLFDLPEVIASLKNKYGVCAGK